MWREALNALGLAILAMRLDLVKLPKGQPAMVMTLAPIGRLLELDATMVTPVQ